VALLARAFGDAEVMVAATAADGLGAAAAAGKLDAAVLAPLVDLAAGRLAQPGEPEPTLSFLNLVCAKPSARHQAAVRAAHGHASVVVRAAARTCLTTMTGADPGEGRSATPSPRTPADPVAVLGKRVVWTVTTSRGAFVVELDGSLAPWNVATLTLLAQRGFYDGTLWHRVVPDFVVQGGDPTGSGWGGPGYTVPAEASQTPYDRGAVGIADAGKDTGGSQWFIMHSAAPHLEQRYTLVGQVTSGMDVVDRLLVGDTIVKVEVTIR
jgi:cyclophilin family peptidyl-prolyl cis-trans isomerase